MRALIVGESGGIGRAVASHLRSGGAEVLGLTRRNHGFDITDEASIAAHLGAIEGHFDLIFVATGGLGHPEKTLKSVAANEMVSQFALNAMGPLLTLKHAVRLMPRNRRAVFAALSARVGSIGDNHLGGWYSYRAAKAALNQMMHTAAIELARSHPQAVIACLHPGTVATSFTKNYDRDKFPPDKAAHHLLSVIEGLVPAQTGGFFDYSGKEVPW
ncbi:SDR family NAD(P)-dependent oxidoreductase [Phaeovulum sp.]|uniref:SDR family NAD(P)-dependent oxidoreductase n=1 Tax=Phaeovulum sp. TaxID=2934796 RepID=UPI0039E2F7E7